MSERLRQIVESMKIRAGDLVLEIGCGHGVAAAYICERLEDGHLVAIDRSRKMIDAAKRKNARAVAAGKASFHVADMYEFEPGTRKFDKVLAVRVGSFHRERAKAETIVKRWLAPRGKLFVVYDEPT